ncbi:MAG: hypothetical protein HC771_16840 [Synechococcales cyanobacterium CRU_2_2]|nr:hypothetical protein [Synechococcales cyanobacterium CRU_2_2]
MHMLHWVDPNLVTWAQMLLSDGDDGSFWMRSALERCSQEPESDVRDFAACDLGFIAGYIRDDESLLRAVALVTDDTWRAESRIFFALAQIFTTEQRQADLQYLMGIVNAPLQGNLAALAWDIYVEQGQSQWAEAILVYL